MCVGVVWCGGVNEVSVTQAWGAQPAAHAGQLAGPSCRKAGGGRRQAAQGGRGQASAPVLATLNGQRFVQVGRMQLLHAVEHIQQLQVGRQAGRQGRCLWLASAAAPPPAHGCSRAPSAALGPAFGAPRRCTHLLLLLPRMLVQQHVLLRPGAARKSRAALFRTAPGRRPKGAYRPAAPVLTCLSFNVTIWPLPTDDQATRLPPSTGPELLPLTALAALSTA